MLLQMQYIEQRMSHVSQEHPFSFMHNFLTERRWLRCHLSGKDSIPRPKWPPSSSPINQS